MTTPYPIRPPTATLYRVRTYASGLPLLSFWARGIGAALTRAEFLAPRYEVVEVHGPGAVVVAAWRKGVPDSADPLAAWPDHMVRDARATWPAATDAQVLSVLIAAESHQADGAPWMWALSNAVRDIQLEAKGGR